MNVFFCTLLSFTLNTNFRNICYCNTEGCLSKKNENVHQLIFLPFYYQGAQFLTELAPLCKIYCSDGEEYTISR